HTIALHAGGLVQSFPATQVFFQCAAAQLTDRENLAGFGPTQAWQFHEAGCIGRQKATNAAMMTYQAVAEFHHTATLDTRTKNNGQQLGGSQYLGAMGEQALTGPLLGVGGKA